MAPRFSTYICWSELNSGTPATYEQFRSELRQFNGPAVVYLCGVMNSVLTDWQGHYNTGAHEELVRNSFAPEFAARIIATGRNPQTPRHVYHRQQLLFVSRQALLECPRTEGKDPLMPPHAGEIARVLLMANDLLPKGLTQGLATTVITERMVDVMSEFIPIGEASGHFRAVNKLVRSRLIADRFLPKTDRDVRVLFAQKTGVSLNDYFALCFATLCRYFDLNLGKYQADPSSFVLTRDWFRAVPVSASVLDSFLADISATAEEYSSSLIVKSSAASDFTCFRSKPLLRENDRYFLIDSRFLAEKGESGVFWKINHSLPIPQRLRFHQDWGLAFEAYVNWIVAESCNKSLNRFHRNPKFSDNGEEVCDGIVECGDSLLFIESKGATFTAEAKYGTDPTTLRDEIEKKLVQKPTGEKGIGQLAESITEVFKRTRPRPIEGLDVGKISKVLPVLVTRDDIGSALLINAYLASRFRDLFSRKTVAVKVTPPHCLSAQDLEIICGYLQESSFADLLDARFRADRGMLASFWMAENEVINRIGNRECKVFADALRFYFREAARTLFPDAEGDI